MDINQIKKQTPLAMSNFVIHVANEKNNPITNLKLQKVLFFLQGYFLSTYNVPLIEGNFSKWQYGPVQKSVYQEFKYLGSSPIKSESVQLRISNDKFVFDYEKVKLSEDWKKNIQGVIEKIIIKEPWQLVRITHSDPSWKNYEDSIKNRTANDYTYDEIKECFESNREVLGI